MNVTWQRKKQNLFVQAVAMNLLNGWADVQAVENGIRWWKKLRLLQRVRGAFQHSATVTQKAVPIIQVEATEESRVATEMGELNRVLGGGIVAGSLVLIGGDPGIGKSTLLLQVSALLSNREHRVLYISGEESIRQTKLRAERLGVVSQELYIYSETNLEFLHQTIDEVRPKFVIVDSIQTVFHPEVTSAPGSVSQVRECTAELMRIAKTKGIAIF